MLSSITLQEAVTESPKRTKKDKTLQYLSRSDSGHVIANVATPIQGVEGEE